MTPSSPGRERSDPAGASALLDSLKKAPPPRKLLSYVEDKKLRFEPGSKYEYSNTDNVAIALIVKAATGRTYKSQLQCGTVWGHRGNFFGYTQFMAASPNGRRSVTVSVNERLTPEEGAPGVFKALRRAEERAVCAALADR
jgi:hypothetical protein